MTFLGYSQNFKTAIKELVGADINKTKTQSTGLESDSLSIKDNIDIGFIKDDALNNVITASEEITIIGNDTHIAGDLEVDGNLIIFGTVEGNIKITRQLFNYGTIIGNISAETVKMSKSGVYGEIEAFKLVELSMDSSVKGNIKSDEIFLNGKVLGDVIAKRLLVLGETGVIVGNIQTDQVSIKTGAQIKGLLETQIVLTEDIFEIKIQ